MVSYGRTDGTILVAATLTSEPSTVTPMEVNDGGVEKRVGERVCDEGVRESRMHIPDFEDVLNEIDEAIYNGLGNPELKAAVSEKTTNWMESTLNLVDVEIREDNPDWKNEEQDRNGVMLELNTDTVMSGAEFSLGWVSMGLKGVTHNSRPNKGASKGKQKVRPNVISERPRNDKTDKETVGLSEGSWKRRARQSPSAVVDPPLSIGAETKRKPESSKRDIFDVNLHEKKKKVTEISNIVEAAKVVGQPRRDQ